MIKAKDLIIPYVKSKSAWSAQDLSYAYSLAPYFLMLNIISYTKTQNYAT